jgi:hypothetical protein
MPERSNRLRRWLEQERPWPDALTAVLLVPLGVVSAVWGLGERASLGGSFLRFEAAAVLVAAAGILALATGANRAFWMAYELIHLHRVDAEIEDLPALIHGVPFAVASAACFALMLMLPIKNRYEQLATGLIIAAVVGLVLFLLVPLALGIGRALEGSEPGSQG